MAPQEGMQNPEQKYHEALHATLETNRYILENLPADGSALALQLAPEMFHFDAMNGANYEMLNFQVDGLLGGNRVISDVLSREVTYDDGRKATGTTYVYEMPIMDESGVGASAYLAVNMGTRANNGVLTLTASREHPAVLDKKARENEPASRLFPAAWLMRKLAI